MNETIVKNSNEIETNDSIFRQILVNIDHLISVLSKNDDNELSSSITITNVTINDDNHRIIEDLRHRIYQLEHERNVLLSSYQLLIKLLK